MPQIIDNVLDFSDFQRRFFDRIPTEDTVFTPLPELGSEDDISLLDGVEEIKQVKKTIKFNRYSFYTFYHPHVCTMIRQLNRYGIDGLLNPQPDTEYGPALIHQKAAGNTFDFNAQYAPEQDIVDKDHPDEDFDFDFDDPYGNYNWELFYHGPLTIASRLSQNQKFEEAQKWFHYIFDPRETDGGAPQRYWKIKPFYEYFTEENSGVEAVLSKMNSNDLAFNRQLNEWMKNPFQPHAVARLRITAYMKSTVMKYIDNLIAWGDNLFRRDTIESINEATQLYILAAQILGPKPVAVSKPNTGTRSVADVLQESNPILQRIESEIGEIDTGTEDNPSDDFNSLNSILLFCTSPNDKLLGYWDTVADRLFKIRNCQNIEGVTRSLALFQPPIDPALLVRASAAGLSIGDVLNSISGTSLPYYRFRYLIQKALELCGDVKNLGGALLSALEKKDAEELSLLRAGQEIDLLKEIRQVRQRNIEESEENLASLEVAKELTETRKQFYSSREYMNRHEEKQLKKMDRAMVFEQTSGLMSVLGSALSLFPDIDLGVSGAFGSPVAKLKTGGESLANSLNAISQSLRVLSAIEQHGATKAGIKGGYDRRRDDWELQTNLAEIELEQIEKQITAAQIRIAVAEKELQNHDLQTQQSQDVEAFMKTKYTNNQLYNWMITQISSMYFQSYQLAYEVARMAEQAYQHELAKEDQFFIQFGHWDSLKKGLLSGEKLQRDIRRMEIAYIEQNKREYELTKHISLSMLAPEQLMNLRETGSCDIMIPEVLFDLDHPGHYLRRIKSVSLSIPCVTGPYTNVSAKLTLISNRWRNTSQVGQAGYKQEINDPRFKYNVGGIQSIATSSAQNDAGLFELNFQDERYLPFEGSGAISTWKLELNSDYRQFDYDTIVDVVIHMNYMSREGGELLRKAANNNIAKGLEFFTNELAATGEGIQRLFSMKTHFPNNLYQLLQPVEGESYQKTTLAIKKEHFPHFLRDRDLTLDGNAVFLVKAREESEVTIAGIEIAIDGGTANTFLAGGSNQAYPLDYANHGGSGTPVKDWNLQLTGGNLESIMNSEEIEDIYLLINYKIS